MCRCQVIHRYVKQSMYTEKIGLSDLLLCSYTSTLEFSIVIYLARLPTPRLESHEKIRH